MGAPKTTPKAKKPTAAELKAQAAELEAQAAALAAQAADEDAEEAAGATSNEATDAGQPSAADLDAVAAEQAAAEATSHSTPAATPVPPEQPSTPGAAPAPALGPASFLTANPNVDWSDPNRDGSKVDSLGNEKTDTYQAGPKGKSLPPDVQTDAQKQAAMDAENQRLSQNMANTQGVDSTGKPKGTFEITPGGRTRQGVKLPDTVHYDKPIEAPQKMVGPRGVNAPKDTYAAKSK